MCGSLISRIFGGGDKSAPAPPTPAPPTAPPTPAPVQRAPVEPPAAPTPLPQEDETKRKAKITSKKVQKKKRSAGTTQLATKKPAEGGLSGINTPQGVNTGTGAGTNNTKQT